MGNWHRYRGFNEVWAPHANGRRTRRPDHTNLRASVRSTTTLGAARDALTTRHAIHHTPIRTCGRPVGRPYAYISPMPTPTAQPDRINLTRVSSIVGAVREPPLRTLRTRGICDQIHMRAPHATPLPHTRSTNKPHIHRQILPTLWASVARRIHHHIGCHTRMGAARDA